MINVTLGNNTKRVKVIVDPNTSLREVLEENEINYTTGVMHLDGAAVPTGGLDKTFNDYGITEKCYLLSVVKSENA